MCKFAAQKWVHYPSGNFYGVSLHASVEDALAHRDSEQDGNKDFLDDPIEVEVMGDSCLCTHKILSSHGYYYLIPPEVNQNLRAQLGELCLRYP